jgi:hypothetical protein
MIHAPFSTEEVYEINDYQRNNKKCMRCVCGEKLYADINGLYCSECFYSQNWIYDYILEEGQ